MKRILVGIKRVVDYNVRIRVKPDGSGVITDGVKMSVNPFDEIALEEALRIKERGLVEEVIVATVGPADCQQQLRTALAMGADRALHVQADGVVEPLVAARALLKLIEREQPLLVILGKQAIDDDNGQTGQVLAALWNRPQATYASKIELSAGTARVTREVDAGLETLEVDLPAVITTDLRLNEPLRQAPGHHEGEEKTTRHSHPERPRGRAAPAAEARALRPPAAAAEGHQSNGCRGAARGAQEQGSAVNSRVLIVAEHEGAKLNPSTAKCVTCAQGIPGAQITIVVCAVDAAAVAAQAAQLSGVARVLCVENPANAHALAAVWAPQVLAIAAPFSHILGPSTTFGKDLMARIAGLLGAPQVSDIMAIESATRFRRPVYAGNALLTVESSGEGQLVGTVRIASFQAAAGGGAAPIEKAAVSVELPTHTRFVSLSAARSDRPDLQTARRLVSAGRAVCRSKGFKILYRLADNLGAAVGASRAAVDAGYAPNEMQVGQTGKIIAPELYVAVGISGAIQHLTGIKR